MKTVILLSVVVLLALLPCEAKDLVVGRLGGRLVWHTKAEYIAIPLTTRTKDIFYSDPSQQIIRGIVARDLDNSEGEATITAGGVGSAFVNIHLKSARGSGLNYQIEIYV